MKENITAGEYIRLQRTKRKLSMRELSDLTGVSFSTIARIESDKDALFSRVARIANALDISLSALADLGEEKK